MVLLNNTTIKSQAFIYVCKQEIHFVDVGWCIRVILWSISCIGFIYVFVNVNVLESTGTTLITFNDTQYNSQCNCIFSFFF